MVKKVKKNSIKQPVPNYRAFIFRYKEKMKIVAEFVIIAALASIYYYNHETIQKNIDDTSKIKQKAALELGISEQEIDRIIQYTEKSEALYALIYLKRNMKHEPKLIIAEPSCANGGGAIDALTKR